MVTGPGVIAPPVMGPCADVFLGGVVLTPQYKRAINIIATAIVM
jgi:hypothetical protein